jgi:hypothetical protein
MAAVADSLSCARFCHRFVHRLARRVLVTLKPDKPSENPLASAVQPGSDWIGIQHNDHYALGDGTNERAASPGGVLCLGIDGSKYSYFGRARAITVVSGDDPGLLEISFWAKYSPSG